MESELDDRLGAEVKEGELSHKRREERREKTLVIAKLAKKIRLNNNYIYDCATGKEILLAAIAYLGDKLVGILADSKLPAFLITEEDSAEPRLCQWSMSAPVDSRDIDIRGTLFYRGFARFDCVEIV